MASRKETEDAGDQPVEVQLQSASSFEDLRASTAVVDVAETTTTAREDVNSLVNNELNMFRTAIANCNISVRDSPLPFWQLHRDKLSLLHKVALPLLITQASSTPSERLFSVAGLVDSSKRARLSEKTLSMLVFGKCNMHLL
jgi:hypothetical protein